VEILVPSTRRIDQVRKQAEYKRLPTAAALLFIEPAHAASPSSDAPAGRNMARLAVSRASTPSSAARHRRLARTDDIYEGVPLEEAG
jgi:hypothetical protein